MSQAKSISAFFPCYNDAGTIASMVITDPKQRGSAGKDIRPLIKLLDSDGKNPSEAIIDALQKYKAKRIAHKDKGKNNTHSKEREESDVESDREEESGVAG